MDAAGFPVLYSFRRCPYAMRARMALLASGQRCEIREILLRDKPNAMIQASPKATVPVLVLADGKVIDESLQIMRWALLRHDPEGWLAGDDAALIAANDGPFKFHLDRYKYPSRHGDEPLAHRQAGADMLADLDAKLGTQPFLCGGQRGLADIALFPFIRQFAATDQHWFDALPLRHVQRWLTSLTTSDLFAQAMLRLPQWKPGDAPVLFASG